MPRAKGDQVFRPIENWPAIIQALFDKGLSPYKITQQTGVSDRLILRMTEPGYDPFYDDGCRILELHAKLVKGEQLRSLEIDWPAILNGIKTAGMNLKAVAWHIGTTDTGLCDIAKGMQPIRHGFGVRVLKLHTTLMNCLAELKEAA